MSHDHATSFEEAERNSYEFQDNPDTASLLNIVIEE